MRLNNKKILITILLIMEVIMLNLTYHSFLNKEINEDINVKETPKNKKQFAIFIKENDEYVEYKKDRLFPQGYYINKKLSKCVDDKNNLVDNAISSNGNSVTVTSDKTIYCTLYFDKNETLEYLRSKDANNYLTKEITGGMYRYQGAFPDSDSSTMPNWICFGTTNQDECKNNIDKYMYRIIGINENGQLYLLKETILKEEEVLGFAWNDETRIDFEDDFCLDGVCPEWNEADLFQRINGIANGTKAGNGNANDGVDNDTDIFVDSKYYDYLKSGDENSDGEATDWYNLIDIHSWYYGDTTENSDSKRYNGDEMYAIETGKTSTKYNVGKYGSVTEQTHIWTNKVNAKICLMYTHDVDYAYPGGIPGSNSKVVNSWIHFKKDGYNLSSSGEWLSSRFGIVSTKDSYVLARRVMNDGNMGGSSLIIDYGVRPVFYLSNDIRLTGDGTKTAPFTLII